MYYQYLEGLKKEKRYLPRLPGYDYSTPGNYFVTIDCFRKECHFGRILKGKMLLSEFGQIAYDEWYLLPHRFNLLRLHTFQIMPNHLHAIVALTEKIISSSDSINTEDDISQFHFPLSDTPSLVQLGNSNKKTSESLSDIMGSYKSIVANKCLELYKEKFEGRNHVPLLGKIWKRSFNDKIIRDEYVYKSISRYIRNNPKNWVRDNR